VTTAVKYAAGLERADSILSLNLNVGDWISESFDYARKYAYPIKAGDGPLTITSTYEEVSYESAQKRIALAGVRLANILKLDLAAPANHEPSYFVREAEPKNERRGDENQEKRRIENQEFARSVRKLVDEAQTDLLDDVNHLTIVSFPLKNMSLQGNQERNQYYLLADLSRIFDQVRSTLGKIETDKGAALLAHIEANIPDNQALQHKAFELDARIIAKKTADEAIQSVKNMLRKIMTATSDIALDLTVLTIPKPANVTLVTRGNLKITGTTAEPIQNVYRGAYTIIVEKFGFKTIRIEEDFIDRPGDVLDCHALVPESAKELPSSCDLK
jgi:hypothetical protein